MEEEHITHHDHLGVGSMEHVPIQELPVPSAVGSVGAAPEILPTYSISLSMSLVQGSDSSSSLAVLKKQLSSSSELLEESVMVYV